MQGGIRDQKRVEEEYHVTWSLVSNLIDDLSDAEQANLGRLVGHLNNAIWSDRRNPRRAAIIDDRARMFRDEGMVIDNVYVKFPGIPLTDLMAIMRRLMLSVVRHHLADGIERVVEIGGGFGENLFHLWMEGGRHDASYHLLDLSKAGLMVARRIAKVASVDRFHTHLFNIHAPDFPFDDARRTLVFTSYAIEQVPRLSPQFIDAIRAIPGFVRCVHLEPVGFQIPTDDGLDAERRAVSDRLDDFNRRWTESVDFNQNLYSVLAAAAGRGEIAIEAVRKNFVGSTRNVCSALVWGNP